MHTTQYLSALLLSLPLATTTTTTTTTIPPTTTTTTVQTYSPAQEPSLTYSITIPNTTTTTTGGPIYLRISAPTTLQWASLGQGANMSTANIFLVWVGADKSNITLSPRSGGTGEPTYNPRAEVTLLNGSGVVGGRMIADMRCDNCLGSWGDIPAAGGGGAANGSSGEGGFVMDPEGNNTSWFWAFKKGPELDDSDVNADLGMHDEKGEMEWDLSRARFDVPAAGGLEGWFNPFV
ncbi:CBD9-like protein [Aspergillus saccharolyticus JOP 1030-1]|uniref:CBD9-like protein n=1 Tax=Aspergillus saccharolyticus JOP 1030-1 TaxID=1450539 RepID=A0A319AH92_9EURO|nr:CBD9-like protein [Aspergillus saccharolyticus JOP 1030-1]PYH45982.1 CBD9-like protein [Aspergillus saccharolyticus JOP 1030-1]